MWLLGGEGWRRGGEVKEEKRDRVEKGTEWKEGQRDRGTEGQREGHVVVIRAVDSMP